MTHLPSALDPGVERRIDLARPAVVAVIVVAALVAGALLFALAASTNGVIDGPYVVT